jgi:apolipoprotein N-acyltransferase
MATEHSLPNWILFVSSIILLVAGWLMHSFPIMIFFAFAPLFALADRAGDSEAWEKKEWILLALTFSFLAAREFDLTFIVSSIAYAIVFTLPFLFYSWVRQVLGPRAGKITIILLWMSLEYIILKLFNADAVFLADALKTKVDWMKWDQYTGYLGGTLWILMTNWLAYQALLSEKPFQWHFIILMVLFVAAPMIYSTTLAGEPVSRNTMTNFYSDKSGLQDVMYLARGELMVRTAAWLSTLILLFTFVKSQTKRR